jgi:hypothetical protein
MRKDDILLNEAYKKVHAPETKKVDEAFNVTRARLAGVGGAISGLKNRVVGGLQSGVGKMGAKVAGIDQSQAPTYQAGQAKVQAGKDAGKNAKVDSILKNQTQDINKFASKLTNQLVKLGLGNTATVSDIAGGMTDKLKEILKKEAPASNQLNANAPTAAPTAAPTSAPAAAPAASTSETRSSFSSGPTDQELADLDDSIINPAPAATAPTAAPAASNPSQPPVQQTNTAAQAADAMKETDTGSTSATPEAAPTAPSETTPTAEAPADSASANSAPAATEPTATAGDDSKITDQGGSPENETTPEEVQAATAPTNAPQPKVNKSTYQSKNTNKDVYKFVRTQQGKVWKNQRTKIVPTAAVQSNITNSWIRQQNAAQAEPQNESFKSFFGKF